MVELIEKIKFYPTDLYIIFMQKASLMQTVLKF